MFRIDGPGAVGELPPVREGVSNPGYFGPGNLATGQMSTRVTYEWLNAVQEELTAVIRAAKLDLDKHDNSQLLSALGELTVGPDSVFTPPTASEDGKAGLVPGPDATNPADAPTTFLGEDALWHKLAAAGFSTDLSTTDKEKIFFGVQTLLGDVSLDTLTCGCYFINNNSSAPSRYGLLLVFPDRLGNDSTQYSLIHLFFSTNSSWIRTLRTPKQIGTPPSPSDWGPWGSLSAATPTTITGIGEWKGWAGAAGASSVTLPQGFVWAYYFLGVVMGAGALYEQRCGVAPGGTTITASISNISFSGFVWRIA